MSEAAVPRPGPGVWWMAARPRTLSAAISPVLVGTAVAWRAGAARPLAAAHREIAPEEELYGLLKIGDQFDLVQLQADFVEEARGALATHPLVAKSDRLDWLHNLTTQYFLGLEPGMRVLETGCGTGRDSFRFSSP